jgi:prolyl 4-hydroxylase
MLIYSIVFILGFIILYYNYTNNKTIKVNENINENNLTSPVSIYDNFISKNDCDYLINISQGKFKNSSIYITPTGDIDLSIRSSKNTAFQRSENPVIQSIEDKIINLLNIQRNQIEPIQIVKYEKGNLYKPHYDFFSDITDNVKNQRTHSFIIYLNDLEQDDGGATWFVNYRIRVYPVKTRCIHFKNTDNQGKENFLTLHMGEEILTDKIKYILTIWIRQFPYS